jgi:GNAT superfamily N-acetyltransferase
MAGKGTDGFRIRPLTPADILRLREINPTFTSEATLQVERIEEGLGVTWHLREVPLAEPFDKGHGYDPTDEELAELTRRLARGQGLYLVAEAGERIIALLEVVPLEWNHTAWVWDILVDKGYRRQGVGRSLMQRAIAWAREKGYRALGLETNNINACRFYQRMGLRLSGIRDDFYSNKDLAKGEVAIFWSYALI